MSLSETDLEIIAIGYTFAEETGKVGCLRKNPPEPRTYHPPAKEEQASNEIKEHQNENNQEDDWKNDLASPQKHVEEPKEQEVNQRKEEQIVEKATESTEQQHEDRTISKEIPQNKNENSSTENQHHHNDENISKEETQNEKKESSKPGSPLKKKENQEEESDSDDGEGWINPDNISQHFFTSQKVAESENALGIAIMTSDFAMQV